MAIDTDRKDLTWKQKRESWSEELRNLKPEDYPTPEAYARDIEDLLFCIDRCLTYESLETPA